MNIGFVWSQNHYKPGMYDWMLEGGFLKGEGRYESVFGFYGGGVESIRCVRLAFYCDHRVIFENERSIKLFFWSKQSENGIALTKFFFFG